MSPQGTRRRGSALEAAIFEAALEALGTLGRANLTMEAVAGRAQTGKATLYRRWTSLDELLRDALAHALPDPDAVPLHDNVRDDLVGLLMCYASVVEASHGTAFQALKEKTAGESGRPGLLHDVVHQRIVTPVKIRLADALRRGVERGEVRADILVEKLAQMGPAMIMYECLTGSEEISEKYVISLVDEVLMPALRP